MTATFASDYSFGTTNELPVLPILETFFKTPLKRRGGMSSFDYDNADSNPSTVMCIELKTRRIKHDKYPTTIIGANKVAVAAANPDRVYWFCYKYEDGIWGIQYDKTLFGTFEHSDYSRGSRSDFHNQPQECYFIPIKKLQPIDAVALST